MTENEALEELKTFPANCLDFKENQALHVATKALEEIQQYREIGTVEEIQKKINSLKYDCSRYEEQISIARGEKQVYTEDDLLLEKYRAIGTIEEFKALKEKNTPMELSEHNFQDEVHHYLCPSCRSIVNCNQNYCEECGQALET